MLAIPLVFILLGALIGSLIKRDGEGALAGGLIGLVAFMLIFGAWALLLMHACSRGC
jgi:hypothetical protein